MLSDAWARLFVANTPPNQLINNIIRESIISVRRSDQNARTVLADVPPQSTTAPEKTPECASRRSAGKWSPVKYG